MTRESIPFLRDAIPVVHHHHERWDGSAYPLGLAGPAIPLGARIFALADAFDAMTPDRPYSKATSLEGGGIGSGTRRARISIRAWWPRSCACRSRSSRKRAPARSTRPARIPGARTSPPRRPSA
ncbi:MAG TPA: HD domain-containing phosphohydrolase [Methylomirabilota bacterium]|nr:HD domain-containing phosphohydrolase [Methylomirabilota bacterium]